MTLRARLVLLTLLVFTSVAAAGSSPTAAAATLKYPLHYGNVGRAVCDAQWLVSQRGAPGAFRRPWFQVWKQPIKANGRCVFTHKLEKAVIGIKWRLGYCPPNKNQPCTITARFDYPLRRYLTGADRRTNKMQLAAYLREHPPKKCTVADRMTDIARREVGQHEIPWGSNYGPRVSIYLATSGIRGPAFWCAAFAQTILKWAGIGPVAAASAGVGYISSYASQRHWTRNDVRKGYLVAWGTRHIGLIDTVVKRGRSILGFYTIEGNASNQVMRRFYRYRYLLGTMIAVPGLDRKIACGS